MNKLFFVLFVLAFASCKKEDELAGYNQWDVQNVVNNKAIVAQHAKANITVYWPYSNGCQIVNKFTNSGGPTIIEVKTYGTSVGEICTQDAGIKSTLFEYTCHDKGSLEFRFLRLDGSNVTALVLVN